MAQVEAKVDALLKDLRAQFHAKKRDISACKATLRKLKLQLIHFQLTPPFSASGATVKKQMLLVTLLNCGTFFVASNIPARAPATGS